MTTTTAPTAPLLVLPPRPDPTQDWRPDAACAASENPSAWIDLPPIRIRGRDNPAYDTTKATLSATCATCPVLANCLWAALDSDAVGIFGGTDEYDRADLRDAYDLPAPAPVIAADRDTDSELRERAFEMRRAARRGMRNVDIAREFGVSAMTVTRALSDDTDDEPDTEVEATLDTEPSTA